MFEQATHLPIFETHIDEIRTKCLEAFNSRLSDLKEAETII
jgi:hypothetical protein